jgi:hypothetical protein
MTLNVQREPLESSSGTHAVLQLGSERLRAVCNAIGLERETERVTALFGRLVSVASDRAASTSQRLGDGLAPLEVFLVSGAKPELGMVVELGTSATEIASLLRELARDHEVDASRFEVLQDLFFTEKGRETFGARLSVSLAEGRPATFEIYLDPSVTGRTRAPLLIERSLVRLGFTAAWPCIGQRLTARGPDDDELKYVAIDLSSSRPRVKVYARHLRSDAAVLDAAARSGRSYRNDDALEFLRSLKLGSSPFDGLAPLTCYEFSTGTGLRPDTVAIELPICGYAEHDAAIRQNILTCLDQLGIAKEQYERALSILADGPLDSGVGVQSYVGFWRDAQGKPAIAVRFPLSHSQIGRPDTVAPKSGVMEVVERYEDWDAITNHPFLHRLRSEPVNLHHIWYILANFQASISKTFSQRLALIASRVDDPHTRYIVTDLLYDEMGSGNYDLAHVNLFSNMMKIMEPWKPAVVDSWVLGAAERFNRNMDETYGNSDVNVALGAIVSGEIFGKQFDQFLGDEIRRQNTVDPALFVWVTLHESLEVTHAGEGADIARLVPPEGVEAMARGAYGLSLGAWGFLTDVYEICYGERPTA